jgi:hypothetical protein
MADNNSDERRLDPRIYYDLPLNSLKPSVPFFFFFILLDSRFSSLSLTLRDGGDAVMELGDISQLFTSGPSSIYSNRLRENSRCHGRYSAKRDEVIVVILATQCGLDASTL